MPLSPSNANTATAPRFNTSEWVLEIQAQHENVFWGPSMWRRNAMDDWTMYEATGSISQDGSGKIGIVVKTELDGGIAGNQSMHDHVNLIDTGSAGTVQLEG